MAISDYETLNEVKEDLNETSTQDKNKIRAKDINELRSAVKELESDKLPTITSGGVAGTALISEIGEKFQPEEIREGISELHIRYEITEAGDVRIVLITTINGTGRYNTLISLPLETLLKGEIIS